MSKRKPEDLLKDKRRKTKNLEIGANMKNEGLH